MGFFKNAIFIKQCYCYCIVLTLRIVLKTLTFLDLDENIERRQLLLHMSYRIGKEFINAHNVMMAAPNRIMTARQNWLHRQIKVGVLMVACVT